MNRYRWTIVTPIKKIVFCTPENNRGFSIGPDNCDVRLPLPRAVTVMGNTLTCMEGMLISSTDGLSQRAHIFPRRVLQLVDAGDMTEYMRIGMEKITDADDAWDRTIKLREGTYTFGTQSGLSVVYPAVGDMLTKDFSITCTNNKLVLRSDDVLFGVYVNQKRVKPGQVAELREGDFVFSGSANLYCDGMALITGTQTIVNGLDYQDKSEENSHLKYPLMQRMARPHLNVPSDEIEILDPPQLPEEQERNIFVTIMPALIMILLIIVVRGNGSLSGNSMIIFSAASMAVGIFSSAGTYLHEANRTKKKKKIRQTTYKNYISGLSQTISKRREAEREKLNTIYIDPQKEIQQVNEFSAALFDRVQGDHDFLTVRLGLGNIRSGERLKNRKQESFTLTDGLFYEPQRLKDEYTFINDVPVVLPLLNANAVGFLGGLNALCQMMQLASLDLAVRHNYEDVKLYYLVNDDMGMLMQAMRWLPHVQDEGDGLRNIAIGSEGYGLLLEKLCRILAQREADREGLDALPWLVINIHADDAVMRHPLMNYVPNASRLKAVFCFWASEREKIPLGCTYEIKLFTNVKKGMLRRLDREAEDLIFAYTPIDNAALEAVSRRLAPVYNGEINLDAELRGNCSFFEALGITEAKPQMIASAWQNADTVHSIAVPIGLRSGDKPVYLDLHEGADGPHGLIAGTTGSGKSEVILSYLLSLIYHYSPDDINIVIIDFKGGGLGRLLQGVPHLTGLITNLEKHEIDRSLMSIKAELERRQRLLAQAEVSNISDYTELKRKCADLKPMPHLIVVVDEFAELKTQQPQFMDELISTARIGRSLGVHLILSTQKPSGVVNEQITGNMDFTLCLRVQSKADSNELLQSPLAAEIRQPGRAYLKVARKGLLCLFQSGYSGASADIISVPSIEIKRVTLTGRREVLFTDKTSEKRETIYKQFDAVKRAVLETFKELGEELPQPLCLPSLGENIPYPEGVNATGYDLPIAIADDPANQRQFPYALNVAQGNTIIVGSPQTGKTTLLQTIVFAAAERFTAGRMNIYVMDFNSGLFKTYEKLDVIGGVVQQDDEESIKNLLRMLNGEIVKRKDKLLEAEVISFASYCEAGHTDLPAVLLIIDNYTPFREIYDEKFGAELQNIFRDGAAVGINCIVTCAQSIALGYRRLCYFKNRIALYSADKTEYSSALEGGHDLNLPELPGRMLFKQENGILTAQAYRYYAELDDRARADKIRNFIKEHGKGQKAGRIPGIPALLTGRELDEICGVVLDNDLVYYAMDFASVEPVALNMASQFEIALISATDEHVRSFVGHLARSAARLSGGMNLRIIDNFKRTLDNIGCKEYTLDPSASPLMVSQMCETAKARMEKVKASGLGSLITEPYEILVINSVDAINALSKDEGAMKLFEEGAERLSAMKLLFVFADMANRQVSYSAPPLYKHIRDARKAIVYENAAKISFFELNLNETRANSQPLGKNDAIVVSDRGAARVRMIK